MVTILKLPLPTPKFGFTRVKKRKDDKGATDQLHLFAQQTAKIINLPLNISPFDHALLLDERGDRKAKGIYEKAIIEGDCVADAYCNLGIIESQNGRTSQAFDCFTNSLKLEPRHFESHYNLANLYFDAGDLKLAKLHYGIAAEIEPNFPNTYFNWGLVLAMNNEFRKAVDILHKFQQLVPESEARKADELVGSLERSLGVIH